MAKYYDFFFSFASADWRKGNKDDLEVFRNHLEDKYTKVRVPSGKFAETILK